MENKIKEILETCQKRREMGADTYGMDAWKGRDMFIDMIEEHYDIINYNLFQIMKLEAMKEKADAAFALAEEFINKDEGHIVSEDKPL